jgi:hypothetical protein
MSPHLWKSSLDPAPCGDPGAIERDQQFEQGSINALELGTAPVAQEGQIPLEWSTARTLEIDPSDPFPSEQIVAFVRLTVEGLFGVRAVIEPVNWLSEALSQKLTVVWIKSGHWLIPGSHKLRMFHRISKARQRDVDPGHGVVNNMQRTGHAESSWLCSRLRLMSIPKRNDKARFGVR